jgi:hypothetical protein
MQMKKIAPYFLSFLVVAFLFSNCKKKTTDEEVLEDSFDKSGMLTNYADNVILPNLTMAKNALDSFATFYNDFKLAKNTANLTVARQRFIRAYEAFQYIGTFEYGPSETEFVRSNFNTYPCDTNQIKTNIFVFIFFIFCPPMQQPRGISVFSNKNTHCRYSWI